MGRTDFRCTEFYEVRSALCLQKALSVDPRASTRLMVVAVVLVTGAVTSLGLQQRPWHVLDQSPASVDPPPATASSSWSDSSSPSPSGEELGSTR